MITTVWPYLGLSPLLAMPAGLPGSAAARASDVPSARRGSCASGGRPAARHGTYGRPRRGFGLRRNPPAGDHYRFVMLCARWWRGLLSPIVGAPELPGAGLCAPDGQALAGVGEL